MSTPKNDKNKEPKDKPIVVPISFDLSIIRYAKAAEPSLEGVSMTPEMEAVLWALEQGNTLAKTCRDLKVPRPLAESWKIENKLFGECCRLLNQIRGSDMEDSLLIDGANGKLTPNERMFAIKGNLPQYRDNYLPPPSGVSNVTIMLGAEGINQIAGLISRNNKRGIPDQVPDQVFDQEDE